MVNRYVILFVREIFPVIFLLVSISCRTETKQQNKEDQGNKNLQTNLIEGEKIALQICGNCHLFPSPELLDKETWRQQVMPQMALYSGIYFDGKNYHSKIPDNLYEKDNLGSLAKELKLYPDSALIQMQEWLEIERYYYNQAPEKLADQSKKVKFIGPSSGYSLSFPPFSIENSYASTTLLDFDSANQRIYLGDNRTATLYILDTDFQLLDQYATGSAPVKVIAQNEALFILTMGTFEARGTKEGELLHLENGEIKTLIKNLDRPVDFVLMDITGDNQNEILIAEFGSLEGSLSWYSMMDTSAKHEIYKGPGTTKIHVKDLNQNGVNDIAVLIAHGTEGVFFFLNQGNGTFIQNQVIEMPPVYGSSYFTFADITGDGIEDIVYVNGDNADLSPVLKPYHGVRVFQNNGGHQYKETQFIPLYGGYKVICEDFNNDGLIDIAVVAFFPDHDRESEAGLVLLEQKSDGTFSSHSFPETREGRWMCMTSGDFSGDGQTEILLGAHLLMQGPPVPLHLRNLWAQKNRTLLKVSKAGPLVPAHMQDN